jgi:hypothetical protein
LRDVGCVGEALAERVGMVVGARGRCESGAPLDAACEGIYKMYIRSIHTIISMFAKVGRWGNSLAVRIPGKEAERLGIKDGDEVRIVVLMKVPKGKVDLSGAPVFHDPEGKADVSENIDHYLELAYEEKYPRARRR